MLRATFVHVKGVARMWRKCLLLVAAAISSDVAAAQTSHADIRVEVTAERVAVQGARVVVNGSLYTTDVDGVVVASVIPGAVEITVSREGFFPAKASVSIDQPGETRIAIELRAQEDHEEQVTVYATRTDERLQDLPTRVEVLGREEIEEKMMMTPGDIVMMLNETGGLRVQTTSPSLGAASVRIQGMRGRYTRFLSDGLPLFGQQGAGLGLLQIPPMDLAQLEVIKGTASALYGAGAMAGVVNLISRRPQGEPIYDALLNRSTLGGTDAAVFLGSGLTTHTSGTILAGGHWQERRDLDDDGWADLASYRRGVLRPRLFWDNGSGRTAFLTGGATHEDREGGTILGALLRYTGEPYREALETRRYDVGGQTQLTFADSYVLSARFAASTQRHRHQFGEILERDRHEMFFGEIAARGTFRQHTWVAGVAADRDAYSPRDVPRFAYTFRSTGVFLQDDIDVSSWLSISVSGRVDFHNEYGTFFSPRLAALLRWEGWTSRLSFGQGFFAPTPLSEETEAAGLSRLAIPVRLIAERGRSASLDLTRTIGPASITATLFGSQVRNPVDVDRSAGYELRNLPEPTSNAGMEVLGTWRKAPFAATASYVFVRSREFDAGRRVDVPLTPRHSFGLVGMWEKEDIGRFGAECYFTGRQRLEQNPYRAVSKPYTVFGFLAERKVGPLRLFLNAENLSNVRQTRWDPLVGPRRAPDGRWTVDAWAPLEGRAFNGGVRLAF